MALNLQANISTSMVPLTNPKCLHVPKSNRTLFKVLGLTSTTFCIPGMPHFCWFLAHAQKHSLLVFCVSGQSVAGQWHWCKISKKKDQHYIPSTISIEQNAHSQANRLPSIKHQTEPSILDIFLCRCHLHTCSALVCQCLWDRPKLSAIASAFDPHLTEVCSTHSASLTKALVNRKSPCEQCMRCPISQDVRRKVGLVPEPGALCG